MGVGSTPIVVDQPSDNIPNVDFSTLFCLPFSAPLTYNGNTKGTLPAPVASMAHGIRVGKQSLYHPYNVEFEVVLAPGMTGLAALGFDLIRTSLGSGFFYWSSWPTSPAGLFVTGTPKVNWIYQHIDAPDIISGTELFEKTFKQTLGYADDIKKMSTLFSDWNKIIAHIWEDASFSIFRPYGEEAYNELAASKYDFSNPVKINGRYNFYLQPYEDYTKNISELYLPNIYGLYEDAANGSFDYWEQWALGHNSVWPAGQGVAFDWKTDFNAYLNRVANVVDMTPNQLQKLRKYQTIGLSVSGMDTYQENINIIKRQFPFYVDIQIPTNRPENEVGDVAAALLQGHQVYPIKGLQFFDIFMKTIMASYYPIFKDGSPTTSPPTTPIGEVKIDGSLVKGECDSVNLTTIRPSLFNERVAKLHLNTLLTQDDFPIPNLKFVNVPVTDPVTGAVIGEVEGPYAIEMWLNSKVNAPVEEPVVFNMPEKTENLMEFQINALWAWVRAALLNIIEEKLRSVKDIYDGKLAHSEILFYEIVKYDVSVGNKSFVQNIFIPNVGPSTLQYVDTQVGFGKKYYYQIYAHTFVIGTEYKNINKYGVEIHPAGNPFFGETEEEVLGIVKHSSDSWMTPSEKGIVWGNTAVAQNQKEEKGIAFFQYEYSPTVYMMRVPYHNTYVTAGGAATKQNNVDEFNYDKLEKTLVFDKPPVFPDAAILPLYGEKNKILINTNFNVGEYLMEPILIDGDETTNIDKIRLNQKRMEGGPIIYSKDDFGGLIELLRIEKKPTSYKDYSPVSDTRVAILGGEGAFGFIDDTLEPDKTYYYIVRTKDVHGSYSNPSSVYEVRIITSDGEKPYLIVNALFMEQLQKEKKTEVSNMMKYIKIAPAFLQSYLDQADVLATYDSAEEVTTNLVFGEPGKEEDVFGKKFKIRFTSKKTGRKFDLNITVKAPSIREPAIPSGDIIQKAPIEQEFPPPNAPGMPAQDYEEELVEVPAGAVEGEGMVDESGAPSSGPGWDLPSPGVPSFGMGGAAPDTIPYEDPDAPDPDPGDFGGGGSGGGGGV